MSSLINRKIPQGATATNKSRYKTKSYPLFKNRGKKILASEKKNIKVSPSTF